MIAAISALRRKRRSAILRWRVAMGQYATFDTERLKLRTCHSSRSNSMLFHSGRTLMNWNGSNGSLETSTRGWPAAVVSGRAFSMPVSGKARASASVRVFLHPQLVARLHDVEHPLGRKHREHLAVFFARIGVEIKEGSPGQAGIFTYPEHACIAPLQSQPGRCRCR